MVSRVKSFPGALTALIGARRRLAGIAVIVCLCLVFSVIGLHAQGYGSISGTVMDSSGAVVMGANVVAVDVRSGTAMTTTSARDGRYVFPTLLPAGYTLTIRAAGFELHSQKGIVLEADQALTMDITLKVGSQTQTVSVSADASQVDTTTGTLSQAIDRQRWPICR
jgi:Carboxypeptidase regulatory-like domain